MITEKEIKTIKEFSEEFFERITLPVQRIEADFSSGEKDAVDINVKLEEPQILIGERGQTLFEIQKLLRIILNKKLQKPFYLNLDVNDYKKKKVDYLKSFARDLADEVAFTKEEKKLLPMSSYERRAIHSELSSRTDIVTESHGEEPDRCVVIKPKQ